MSRFTVEKVCIVASTYLNIHNDICPICKNALTELCSDCIDDRNKNNCETSVGICNHGFHTHCIKTWLLNKRTCPLDNQRWEFKKFNKSNSKYNSRNTISSDDDNENNEILGTTGPTGPTGPINFGTTGPTGPTGPINFGTTGPTGPINFGTTGPTNLGQTGPTNLGQTGPTNLGQTGPARTIRRIGVDEGIFLNTINRVIIDEIIDIAGNNVTNIVNNNNNINMNVNQNVNQDNFEDTELSDGDSDDSRD